MSKEIITKENVVERPPVIVVMGHIDHGKSKLLDYIRKSHIVEGEAGGITQHISAYEVEHEKDSKKHKITFLDTPGHEAFKGMRARGAKVADIAILVVAADDGVKAQTIEAFEAIKQGEIPYIVAINKIDKPNADINKAIESLIENEIYIEGYGGDIPYVKISALNGDGIPELLDTLLLVAELEELKGDTSKPAEGVVIETHVDPKKGTSATLIIKDGTLKKGMYIGSEKSCSPVRILEDFQGNKIDEASFSSPIQITGFTLIPEVGAQFLAYPSRKDAEKAAMICKNNDSNDDAMASEANEDVHVIPVILKSDVVGTLEAVQSKLKELETERTKIKVLHTGVGTVTENDVQMAGSSENAYVIGFNVKIDRPAKEAAEKTGVKIETFDIIYKLLEWFEEIVQTETPKMEVEEMTGQMKVIRVFSQVKDKQVIGGKMQKGSMSKGSVFKILRRNEEVGRGKVLELQTQKMAAQDVHEGDEFGTKVEAKITIAEGDRLESFRITSK